MNFALFSIILLCGVQITKLDRFTTSETFTLMLQTELIVPHDEAEYDENICFKTLIAEHFHEMPYIYFYCDPNLKPVKNQPLLTHCPGFDCWESQLSVVSRLEIIDIMNRYREKVARGECLKWCENNKHKLVYELQWNYYLELNATEYLETCRRSAFFNRSYIRAGRYYDKYIGSGYEELVSTSFKMETGLQSELRSILWRLMYTNSLKDWDEKSQFRRGDMHDVACAFTSRRDTTFVTDLNEKVENGIVGHLACAFVTLIVDLNTYIDGFPAYISTAKEPSLKNCQEYDGGSHFHPWNLYPTLCHRDVYDGIKSSVIYHTCENGPQNAPGLCNESKYSLLTWEEKFYGMTMKYNYTKPRKSKRYNRTVVVDLECLVPIVPELDNKKFSSKAVHYVCTLREVVPMHANTAKCFGWNCADSQLTDGTRNRILFLLNRARNLVAKGECSKLCPHPCKQCNENARYCNMVNLQWHWYLERKASQVVENCPTSNSIRKNITYDDEPFPVNHYTSSYEEITLVFDLPYFEGQLALPDTIEKLFWMNAFEDWTEYHYFRRANAQFIGCSIVSRPYTVKIPEIKPEMNFYNGLPVHMVCIYATINGSFNSILGENFIDCCPECPVFPGFTNPCWLSYIKSPNFPDDSLCTSIVQVFPQNCQIDKRCNDDSISKAWYIQYEGSALVQPINGTLFSIEHLKPFNSIGVLYERTYCRFMVFLIFPQFILWLLILRCIFLLQDVRALELLIDSLTPKFKIRFSQINLRRKIFGEKGASSRKPSRKKSKSAKKIARRKASEEIAKKSPDGAEFPSGIFSEDTTTSDDAEESRGRDARVKKPKKKTSPPEIRTTKRTTTPAAYRAPVARKTPIREAPSKAEDDLEVDDEELGPYVTGPTITIGVKQVGPKKIFTGRPAKQRKAPKRATKTTVAPLHK